MCARVKDVTRVIVGTIGFARDERVGTKKVDFESDEELCKALNGSHTLGTPRWDTCRWTFESSALKGPLRVGWSNNRR